MEVFANYIDGTFDNMNQTAFENIKKDKLKSFCVVDNEKIIFELFFELGQMPIYRRRTVFFDGTEMKIIIIGWRRLVSGELIQSINFIVDKSVIQRGKFLDGMFAEPEWHEFEFKD